MHYEPLAFAENDVLQGRLVELAQERRRFGYRRIHSLLRREVTEVNHKRTCRLYREANLAVRTRKRRRGVAVAREPLTLPEVRDAVWSMDFIFDSLSTSRRLKTLAIVGDCTKALDQWAYQHGVELKLIQAGKPTQNAFVESLRRAVEIRRPAKAGWSK